MSDMVKCIECGKPVHKDAPKCPACNTPHALGVVCAACGRSLKASQAVHIFHHYHTACFERAFKSIRAQKGRVACRSCGNRIDVPYLASQFQELLAGAEKPVKYPSVFYMDVASKIECPKCGNPRVVDFSQSCAVCSLPLVDDSVKVVFDSCYKNYYHAIYKPAHPWCKPVFERPQNGASLPSNKVWWVCISSVMGIVILFFWIATSI
jgi:hypothetical protein